MRIINNIFIHLLYYYFKTHWFQFFSSISDWDPDSKNPVSEMNFPYYTVFEQNYEMFKELIDEENDSMRWLPGDKRGR